MSGTSMSAGSLSSPRARRGLSSLLPKLRRSRSRVAAPAAPPPPPPEASEPEPAGVEPPFASEPSPPPRAEPAAEPLPAFPEMRRLDGLECYKALARRALVEAA